MTGFDMVADASRRYLDLLAWRKASQCVEEYCVAIARAHGLVGIRGPDGRRLPFVLPAASIEPLDDWLVMRNTNDPHGQVMVISEPALRVLLARIKAGGFDDVVGRAL